MGALRSVYVKIKNLKLVIREREEAFKRMKHVPHFSHSTAALRLQKLIV